MRFLPFLVPFLVAACAAGEPGVEATLAARRAALGLQDGALAVADAMDGLERHEAFLRDVFAKARPGQDVLDRALRIENLLRRADFGAEMAAFRGPALENAGALARAAAHGAGTAEAAGAVLRSCLDCHVRFRKPR